MPQRKDVIENNNIKNSLFYEKIEITNDRSHSKNEP